MKNLIFLFSIALVLILSACGGEVLQKDEEVINADTVSVVEETEEEVKLECNAENAITVTIKDYKYDMSGDYVFETPDFEVKMVKIISKSDSLMEIQLSNYRQAELVGDRTDEQVDINMELHAQNGKVLMPGYYPYNEYDSDFWAKVTMTTAKGTIWFNWVIGMEEQGGVEIQYIEKTKVCGTFNLNVEKPDLENIGVVRLNGTFKAE